MNKKNYLKRYKWHDLRKNPNDLPQKNDNDKQYLVMYSTRTYYTLCYYDGWNCSCFGEHVYRQSEIKNVIAWKEIKPCKSIR